MDLGFGPITEADLPGLAPVMTRAFDHESMRYLGRPGGPPGYDNGDFFRNWVFPDPLSRGHKILCEGIIVGAMVVRVFPDGHNHLGMVFVDPAYQRLGIGRRAWQYIEDTYPETRTWTLETAGYATSIHRFYEDKCGFSKVEVKPWGHPLGLWVYRKHMEPGAEEGAAEPS